MKSFNKNKAAISHMQANFLRIFEDFCSMKSGLKLRMGSIFNIYMNIFTTYVQLLNHPDTEHIHI